MESELPDEVSLLIGGAAVFGAPFLCGFAYFLGPMGISLALGALLRLTRAGTTRARFITTTEARAAPRRQIHRPRTEAMPGIVAGSRMGGGGAAPRAGRPSVYETHSRFDFREGTIRRSRRGREVGVWVIADVTSIRVRRRLVLARDAWCVQLKLTTGHTLWLATGTEGKMRAVLDELRSRMPTELAQRAFSKRAS